MNEKRVISVEYLLPLLVVLLFSVSILFGEMTLRMKYPELLTVKDSSNEFDIFDSFDPRIGRWHKRNFSHAFAALSTTK